MPFLFEKLAVYQKALGFAEEVAELTDRFPKGSFYLADQLRRAAVSIPANIAEGNGRWHAGDRKSFFYIARGSACECIPLLALCSRRTLIGEDKHKELRGRVEEIARMLTALATGAARRTSHQSAPGGLVE